MKNVLATHLFINVIQDIILTCSKDPLFNNTTVLIILFTILILSLYILICSFSFLDTKVNTVMLMLTKPFAEEFSTFRSADRESGKGEGQNEIIKRYTQTAPPGADGLICTCSS